MNDYLELLDFFLIKNSFFIELSLEENWVKQVASEEATYDITKIPNGEKFPIKIFKEYLYEYKTSEATKVFTKLRSLKSGERYTHELKLKEKDSYQWFKIIFVKNENGNFYGMVQNVNTRLESDVKIKHQGEQNLFILDNIREFVAQYDINGNLIYYNPSFRKQFFPDSVDKYTISTDSTGEKWFNDCLIPPYHSESVAYYESLYDEQHVYIQWFNRSIVVDGEVQSVISLGVDISDMQRSKERLEFELYHDEETGFYNRRGLNRLFNELKETAFDMYYLSISSLNSVNDIYGYEASHELVEEITMLLREVEANGIRIGKLSDSVYVLVNDRLQTNRKRFEGRIFDFLNRSIRLKNFVLYVTADISMVAYPEDTSDVGSLLSYGHLTLNKIRTLRNTRILRFRKSFYKETFEETTLMNDLRQAIDNDDIRLVYQNIIDIQTGKIAYVETLARWNHPVKGPISPSKFFQLANQSYLAIDLDFSIIDKSTQNFVEMKKLPEYQDTTLTINVTPKSFMYDLFGERLLEILRKNKVDAADVCIEVSENSFIKDDNEYLDRVNYLNSQNIIIAIDDFGRKYSSLGILGSINFDVIKVDKVFVDALHLNQTNTIMKMLVQLGKDLDRKIIVEGVETKEQVEILKNLGYRYIQGYVFSKPYAFLLAD